jgi:hypothetical protein
MKKRQRALLRVNKPPNKGAWPQNLLPPCWTGAQPSEIVATLSAHATGVRDGVHPSTSEALHTKTGKNSPHRPADTRTPHGFY